MKELWSEIVQTPAVTGRGLDGIFECSQKQDQLLYYFRNKGTALDPSFKTMEYNSHFQKTSPGSQLSQIIPIQYQSSLIPKISWTATSDRSGISRKQITIENAVQIGE